MNDWGLHIRLLLNSLAHRSNYSSSEHFRHCSISIKNGHVFTGNGKIDFPEFVNMMVLQGDQMAWKEKDLKEAFRTFDSDDKGFMHAAELKYVLMRMDDPTVTDEDIKEMLADTGLNINRKITFKGKCTVAVYLHHMASTCLIESYRMWHSESEGD